MDWTKPVSFLFALLVAAIAVGGVVELLRTTLAGEYVTASVATLVVVGIMLLATIVVGAKNRQWLANPESYW